MKKYLLISLVFAAFELNAQNVGIGTRQPQSKLHVAGDLRVDSLANRDSGLVIYNKSGLLMPLKLTGKNTDVLRGDGTFQSLNAVAASSPNWLTTGNAGLDTASHFLGTIDGVPLQLRVNNIKAGEINPNGNLILGLRSDLEYQGFENRYNTIIGTNAFAKNTTAGFNTAMGYSALSSMTQGSGNVAIGVSTMQNTLSGSQNIAIGGDAMIYSVNSMSNIAIGSGALQRVESEEGTTGNVAIGTSSQEWTTTGWGNTSVGNGSMQQNITGMGNTAMGASSANWNTSGQSNTAIGTSALFNNQVGSYNTAVGNSALSTNEASYNTANGFQSLTSNSTGQKNTSLGASSMYRNTTGNYNLALGAESIFRNTTGSYNSASGFKALFSNTTANYNTALGFKGLYSTTTGSNNTASGNQALFVNITGSNNTAVGALADVTTGNLTNATAIGYNAKVNASNKVRIGNASVTRIEGQVPFSTPSDGRFKFNIKEDVKGLDFIMRLRPVTYQFDVDRFDRGNFSVSLVSHSEASAVRRTGFIAQEVEKAAGQSHYNFSGINIPESEKDHYSLSYEAFVVPLVKGMQEQQETIIRLQQKIDELIAEITQIKSQIRK